MTDARRWARVGRRVEPDPAWAHAVKERYVRFLELADDRVRPTMKALVFRNDRVRQAATKLAGFVSPKAFVGPYAPVRLEDVAEPTPPAPDWVVPSVALAVGFPESCASGILRLTSHSEEFHEDTK